MNRRTVAAITTPVGEGGISVIHVSGASSIEIVNKIFRGKRIKDLSRAQDGRLYYGTIERNGKPIDEAIIHVETQNLASVQINCHGGILSTRSVLDCIKEEGAVEVDWQELVTQSASDGQNNKIDSIQREALLKIPEAKTNLAAKVFLDQYKGALSRAVADITKGMSLRGTKSRSNLTQSSDGIATPSARNDINRLLKTADFGIALSTPMKVTIAGSPNAGKSTLINALLDKERVIVHHEPGTTRDAVTDIISIDGIPLELTDTAGVRHTDDVIEGLAIKETIRRLSATDIAVIVFDNANKSPLPPLIKGGWGDLVEIIPVVNKIDLPSALDIAELQSHFSMPICQISALNGTGLLELKKRLVARFADYLKYVPGRPVVFTERQKELLLEAAHLFEKSM